MLKIKIYFCKVMYNLKNLILDCLCIVVFNYYIWLCFCYFFKGFMFVYYWLKILILFKIDDNISIYI